MERILKLIWKDTEIVKKGCPYKTGVVRIDPQNFKVDYVDQEGKLSKWLSLGDYRKLIRNYPPIKYDFLMIKIPNTNNIIFCNLGNAEISDVVRKDQNLFPLLDRIIQYMTNNDVKQVVFNEEGVYSEKTHKDLNRDSSLTSFNNDSALLAIVRKGVEYSGENIEIKSLSNLDLDLGIEVQGVQIQIKIWHDFTNSRELSIRIELPLEVEYRKKIKPLFEVESGGFIIASSSLIGNLSELLEKNKYQRIAYRGMGANVNLDPKAFCSYFNNDTPIKDLRRRDFDVYVVSLEYLEDPKELYYLPTGKLCVLIADYPDLPRCLRFIKTLCGDEMGVKHYLFENLIAILSEEDKENPYLIPDSWSREMLQKETDVNLVIRKLKDNFIIRDNITNVEGIDIVKEIELVLKKASEVNASNLDICPGSPIRLYKSKVDFVPYSSIKMTPNLIEMMLMNMISPSEMYRLRENGELDTSYSVPGIGRYRLGIVKQRSSIAVSIRRVPVDIPTPKQLNLPEDFIEKAIREKKGFTLIVGEPNSGKTLTFNSLIDEANEKIGGIIFLMGNPIEYTHQHKKALVIQVEIGKDLASYTQGIAKSLRMNTSMLGFEELRTKDEFAALGALINTPSSIFMTMHDSSCRKAVEHLVERLSETGISSSKAQEDVANAINYVIYQKLVDYGGKRILIYEKMRATITIRNLIRQGNFNQIENAMSADAECETLDRVILRRLEDKMLDFDSVKGYVKDRRLFESRGYKF